MVVEGIDGTRLGTVERLEIDEAGRLTNVIVRLSGARRACKRVAAKSVHSLRADSVVLALSKAEVMGLSDVLPRIPDDLLLENVHFLPDVR